ncbi:hypothetical protein FF52_08464 [Flavobacterium sp. F52]|nr:hypothetical protein FF52_08464 [Flavobacterium sp. F52]
MLSLFTAIVAAAACHAQEKPFFHNYFNPPAVLNSNSICESSLAYPASNDPAQYIAFLAGLKNPKLTYLINENLKSFGFAEGIGSLDITNVKYVSAISAATGNFGFFDNFTKVKFTGGTADGFELSINGQSVYFLKSGCIFYPTAECEDCGDYDLIYDFKCKEFIKPNQGVVKSLEDVKVKHNERLRFKVINVNRYLYNVEIAFDDVLLKSNEPELFKKLFLGEGFDIKGINLLNKEAAAEVAEAALGGGAAGADPDNTPLTNFLSEYQEFKKSYNSILENYLKAYSVCLPNNAKCCGDQQASKFSKLSAQLLALQISFIKAKSDFDTKQSNLEKDKADYEKKIADPNTTKKQAIQLKLDLDAAAKQLDIVKTSLASLTEFGKKLELIDDEKLLKLVHFENNFVKDNFEFISPSIFPKGNSLILSVDIMPNTSEEAKKWQTSPLYEDHSTVEFRVKNKWFYSFSTGPFVAIHNQFKTATYGWQRQASNGVIDDTSQYKLVQSGQNGLPVGIGAFANLGNKITDYFGFGATIGVGATILDKVEMAYFLGVTGFFGQDKQFNFTVGASFVQMEKLKGELYPDIGTQLYAAPIDLEYSKKIAAGFFVAVSYTVFESVKTPNSNSGHPKAVATVPAKEATTTPAVTSPAAVTPAVNTAGATATANTAATTTTAPPAKEDATLNTSLKNAKKVKIKFD